MAGRYKEYPEYKNTDIKFLKNIPIHWVTSKVRYISSFGRGLSITKADLQDSGVPCVSYGEVHSMFGFEVDPKRHLLKCVNEEYLKTSSYALLSKGDFIFADTSEDIDGSGNFTQLISDERVFAGYHTVIVRPNLKNHYRFIAYLFDSAEFRTQIQDAVKGVKVFSITQAILKSADVWFPSYEEQQKIANFLDHETAKIDTLIAKQEKLIKLLKEKRQAVISHAVTKGLNPDVRMKDSGVEWLGEVPEHWVVLKLKHLIQSLESGCSVNAADTPAKTGEFGVLKTSCVYTRRFRVEENKTVLQEDLPRVKCPIRKGAIIISRMNTPELVGASALVNVDIDNIYLPDRLWQTNFNKSFDIEAEFLAYFMTVEGFRNQISLSAEGASSSMQNIAKEDYLAINAILPQLKEQIDIVNYIKKNEAKFLRLEAQVMNTIELLKERKTALISAAVTGKIDVRDWQPKGIQE
ncbi:restriction endonuclease subunit S [Providencia rettgeri]